MASLKTPTRRGNGFRKSPPGHRPAGVDRSLKRFRTPLPPSHEPMLCTLVAEPFDHPDWVFEPKLDGLRVLCRFDGREVQLISRNGKSQNFQFPDVVEALRQSLDRPAV